MEYSFGTPVALLELKFPEALGKVDLGHPNYRALINLADHYSPEPLPFFVVYYWPDI